MLNIQVDWFIVCPRNGREKLPRSDLLLLVMIRVWGMVWGKQKTGKEKGATILVVTP